jgi:tRNA(Ile)-lysidine synthase
MEIVRAEADLAGELAAQWLDQRQRGMKRMPNFARLPVAVQRRVLQSQLPSLGLPLDFELIEQLRETTGKPVNTGLNLSAVRDADGVVSLISQSPAPVFKPGELALKLTGSSGTAEFAGVTITWQHPPGKVALPVPPEPGREIFDAAKIGRDIILRHWRAGDRFQPLGMSQAVKLQDLFTNAKIPREHRHELLVATAQGEIFWVEALRIAEKFKLTTGTKSVLVWQWQRDATK